MICAWIGKYEIIPFDNIECVTFDELNDTPVADVSLSNLKDSIRLTGNDVTTFRSQYIDYIGLMSKATTLIEDMN